jgi:hypothetical protein
MDYSLGIIDTPWTTCLLDTHWHRESMPTCPLDWHRPQVLYGTEKTRLTFSEFSEKNITLPIQIDSNELALIFLSSQTEAA